MGYIGGSLKRLGTAERPGGFTLVELMIVIAIVSILVALAVPAYTDYTVRTKVTECIHMMAVPKVQISEFYQSVGRWPDSATEAGVPLTANMIVNGLTEYCWIQTYLPANGTIIVFIDGQGIGAGLSGFDILPFLSPAASAAGVVSWECTRGATTNAGMKYLPSSCRDDNIF